MTYSVILAAAQGGGMLQILMVVAMVAVFYLFMIRPQQKRAKEQSKFLDAVKKGDEVVTVGGVHGRVAEIEGATVMLEIERGGRMKCNKASLSMEYTQAMYGKGKE